MNERFYYLMNDVLENKGLRLQMYKKPILPDVLESLDLGLRKDYVGEEGYRRFVLYFQAMQDNKLYLWEDQFHVHYMFCNVNTDSEEYVLTIGPYLTTERTLLMDKVENRNKNDLMFLENLLKYYEKLTVIDNELILRDNVLLAVEYFLDAENTFEIAFPAEEITEEISEAMLYRKRENRDYESAVLQYEKETEMINAIASGNFERANQASQYFRQFENVKERHLLSLASQKNALRTYNTMCRRAVESAGVHPGRADEISQEYIQKIEIARSLSELTKLMDTMGRTYCTLVRNHSTKGYSELIGAVIDEIDFHLSEHLTLSGMAEKFSVDSGYLSSRFAKEVGKNFISYINEERIRISLQYLAASNLKIAEIAELIGYDDYNYYTRQFKKIMQMTPSQYRATIHMS